MLLLLSLVIVIVVVAVDGYGWLWMVMGSMRVDKDNNIGLFSHSLVSVGGLSVCLSVCSCSCSLFMCVMCVVLGRGIPF